MNIAIACADVQPESCHGGIAAYTRHLADGLAVRGHDVTILGRATHRQNHRNEDGVQLLFLPNVRYPRLHSKFRLLTDKLARSKTLAKYLASNPGFDVVEFPVWDAEGLYPTRLKGFKSVVRGHTPHAIVNDLAEQAGQRVAKLDRVAETLERLAARRANLYLANSQSGIDIAVERFGIPTSRIATCLHGIPSQSHPNDLLGDSIRVLFVGRLEVRKGVLELFEAIPKVLQAHPMVHFEIIGSDSEYKPGSTFEQEFRSTVSTEVQERVTFHGRMGTDEIDLIRRKCQIAALPSKYESFGLVHAEALSFGIPVVAFDIGATREVVEHGIDGLLVPNGDSKSLAQAIIQLIKDETLRVNMGRAAFDAAKTRFSIDAMATCVESAYRRLIAGPS